MAWRTYGADEPRYVLPKGWLLIEGQRTNLITHARTPFSTGWSTVGIASVVAAMGPDGQAGSAFQIVETAATAQHGTGSPVINVVAGTQYSVSVLVRPGSCPTFQVLGTGAILGAWVQNFDLSDSGSLGFGSGVIAPALRQYGIWSLATLTFTAAATGIGQLFINLTDSPSAPRATSYPGTGRDLFVAWCQVEVGPFPSSFILPPVGAPASATRSRDIVSAPFASLFPLGDGTLLVSAIFLNAAPSNANQTLLRCGDVTGAAGWDLVNERPSANYCRNPRCEGAVPGVLGAGGAAPTYWSFSSVGGLTFEVLGVGSADGIDYVRLRLAGTASSSSGARMNLEASGAVAAAVGQAWTASHFVRLVSGAQNGLVWQPEIRENPSAVFTTGGGVTFTPDWQRVSVTRTLSDAGTVSVIPQIRQNLVSGNVYDLVFDVGWPQIEPGGCPTSIMLPPSGSPGVAARAGNSLMLTNGAVSANLGVITPGAVTKAAVTFGGATVRALLDGGAGRAVPKPSAAMSTVRLGNNFVGDAAAFALFGGLFSRANLTSDAEMQSSLAFLPT